MQKKPLCHFSLTLTPSLGTYLKKQLPGYKTTISTDPLDLKTLDPNTEILGVFVDSKIDKQVFKKLKKLKLILALSTGYDNIDIKIAKKRGIAVCNVPDYGQNTVAEFALGLILALSRKIFWGVKRVKEGTYDYHGLRGFDLKDKTIGVFGAGHIGIHFIDLLQGFGARVIGYDAYKKPELQDKHDFTYVSMNTLLKESDIISLHAPLLPSTYHIIDKKAIKKMKPGVHIINTARGGLIDSEALVWGLDQKIVAGAGLDVLEEENFLEDRSKMVYSAITPKLMKTTLMNEALIAHPHTIVTPHSAFNTHEAVRRILDTTIENIKAFTKGKTQYDVTQPRKKK
jgi:D-lactate dehydrogenase